jgi:hypothetical protein
MQFGLHARANINLGVSIYDLHLPGFELRKLGRFLFQVGAIVFRIGVTLTPAFPHLERYISRGGTQHKRNNKWENVK